MLSCHGSSETPQGLCKRRKAVEQKTEALMRLTGGTGVGGGGHSEYGAPICKTGSEDVSAVGVLRKGNCGAS